MNSLIFVFLISVTQVLCFDQLLSLSSETQCSSDTWVTLEGSSGRWSSSDQSGVRIVSEYSAVTNVTLQAPKEYTFSLRNNGGLVRQETVKVVNEDHLPLARLAKTVVPKLLSYKFQYLAMSHRFLAADNHLPNVGKLFRGYVDKTADIIDKVVKYVMAKHVTTSSLDGSNPPDYSCILMEFGFKSLPIEDSDKPSNVRHAFSLAMKIHRNMISALTHIVHFAEEVDDHELIEFVSVDLISSFTESMKTLANYKKTVAKMTKAPYQGLGEFLFDREFL